MPVQFTDTQASWSTILYALNSTVDNEDAILIEWAKLNISKPQIWIHVLHMLIIYATLQAYLNKWKTHGIQPHWTESFTGTNWRIWHLKSPQNIGTW